MADSELVLNDVLCYIVNKFVVSPVKLIKTAVTDFYSVEDIGEAKVCLYNDIIKLNLEKQPPHVPQRRCGDGRLALEVNDIFTLLTFVDEAKALDKLPKYVAGSPDRMPTLRLYEGDLQVLMTILRSLSGKMDDFEASLAAITKLVQAIQVWPSLPEPAAGHGSSLRSQAGQQQQHQSSAVESRKPRSAYNTCSVPAVSCQSAEFVQSPLQSLRSTMDWSAQTSTPVAQSNRFAVLSTESENDRDGVGDGDGDGEAAAYTMVQRSKKRARQQSQPPFTSVHQQQSSATLSQQQRQQQPPPQQQQQQRGSLATRRRSTTILYGKSTKLSNLAAATKLVQKAVFCIDNVSSNCSVKQLRDFVSGLSVKVISCFEVKPRRQRNLDNDDCDDDHDGATRSIRKAFRLCIDKDDAAKLLNPAAWPHSVIISEWFFKSSGDKKMQDTRANTINTDDRPTPRSSSSSSRGVSGDVRDDLNDGGDAQLVMSDGGATSSHQPIAASVAEAEVDDQASASTDDDDGDGTILMAEHNIHDGDQ